MKTIAMIVALLVSLVSLNAVHAGEPPVAPVYSWTNVSESERNVRLFWTDIADNEDGYKVFRRVLGEDVFQEIALLPADSSFYLDSDASLAAQTKYQYKIIAFNAFGESNAVEVVAATPTAPLAPSPLVTGDIGRDTVFVYAYEAPYYGDQDHLHNPTNFVFERSFLGSNEFATVAEGGYS
jgi:hypothetical protein